MPTKLEEMANIPARNAIAQALEAAQAAYGEIQKSRNYLSKLEAGQVYADTYIEAERLRRSESTREAVQGHIAGARRALERARASVEQQLARVTAVSPEKMAAAQGQLGMFLGDLSEDPSSLLGAYERSFDHPADRHALQDLASRALRVLPDSREKCAFEVQWGRLRERLEDRLPAEERELRRGLSELGRAEEYLGHVNAATEAAIEGLTGKGRGRNLTAFSQAHRYELEMVGRSTIEDRLPAMPTAVGS